LLLNNKHLRSAAGALAMALAFCAAAATAAFDLTDTQGKHHRLSDYKGKWVVLNFWATWCVPCIQEIPEIGAFAREHPEVVMIGVAIDVDDADRTKRFAAKLGHDYPLVLASERIARALGSVKALPTTRIFAPTGKVVYDRSGRVDRKLLEKLTSPSSPSTPIVRASF
jgi:thiol-disulfide isomerase/thioredoxin